MKISKKSAPVKASTDGNKDLNKALTDDAVTYIQSAIDSLSSIIRKSQTDESLSETADIAKDCIVDLSTVLLTLKGM